MLNRCMQSVRQQEGDSRDKRPNDKTPGDFKLTKGQNRAKLYIVKGPSGCRSVHAWLAAKGVEAVDNGREVLI